MIKSIQQFEEFGIKKLEKVIENFMKNPRDMASFIQGVHSEVLALAQNILKETLEDCNQMLRDSGKRKADWTGVRTDKKQLLTSIGSIEFEKTMFKNR